MSVTKRLMRGASMKASTIGDLARPGSDVDSHMVDIAARSSAGGTITPVRALGLDSFWSCVRLLSDSIGSLPLKSYRKTQGGRIPVDNTVDRLIGLEPNTEMTAFDLWSLIVVHLNVYGNAFIGKVFDRDQVTELWPIHPEDVRVRRVKGQKVFELRGDTQLFTRRDIVHVQGMSLNGLMGLSPIAYHRETLGKALAQDQFGASFFRNSASTHGVLEVDDELSDDAFTSLEKRWNRAHRGPSRAGRIAILERGVKYKPITLSPSDAQFIQNQNISAVQVARIMRVPASMIDANSGQSLTYRTVESDGIHFARYSLDPWLVRIEQKLAADRDLFPGKPDTYPQFVRQALLRSDSKTRADFYQKALDPTRGWMNRDEVRRAEDLPPEMNQPTRSAGQVRDAMAALMAAQEVS